MHMLLPIHIAAGGLAIILGAIALLVRKGGLSHRRSGLLFVYAMMIMATSAAALAVVQGSRGLGNVLAALMTIYLVGTALTTVRPPSTWSRRFDASALVIPCVIGIADLWFGVVAFNRPTRTLGGVPFPMFFFLATVLLLAASGDVRIMRGRVLRGGPRLARHLWRMCFALFIAVGSFFSIKSRVTRVLPEPFTTLPMRMLPILLVFVAMFYWLWKVRARRPSRMIVTGEPAPAAAAK